MSQIIPFKKDTPEFMDAYTSPVYIFRLLPPGHDCFLFTDIISQLDTSTIEKKYCVRGQNAYHPRLVTGILIYAYSHGVFSSREIEKKCHEDLGFMYISRMNCPDFRTLSDFRKDNHEFFKECFKQSVHIAIEAGLVSFGHVSLDGSKFKASTSSHKAMSYGRLKKKEKELTAEIEELLSKASKLDVDEDEEFGETTSYEISDELQFKEARLEKIKSAKEAIEKRESDLNPGKKIDDKKQISFADEEARIMGKKGHFEYAYNGQISVDEDSQIIIGQHLSQNANDKQEVEPALKEIEEMTGRLPDEASLDNGYFSGDNLKALSEIDTEVYIAIGKGEKKDKRDINDSKRDIKKSDFTYDEEGDFFICPGGKTLGLKRASSDGKKIYQANREDCANCPYKGRCCKSKKGEGRTINTDDKEPLRQEMREKMETESAKEIYKKRKKIVEPVFGQIKNSGFRGFNLRGCNGASGEFSLTCTGHNIKKVIRAVRAGDVGIDSEGRYQKAA